MRSDDNQHGAAAAYVLDALSEPERRRFEAHLRQCEACTAEVGEFSEVAGRLAAGAATPAPPEMKSRVLAMAAHTRQVVPVAAPATAGADRDRVARRWPTVVPCWRAPALVAAVSLAVGGVVGAVIVRSGPSPAPDAPAVAAVLTASDAEMASASVAGGGKASFVMSHRESALVFSAAGLAALPHSKCYELWLISSASTLAAGVLPVPVQGMTGPVIVADLTASEKLGLSVEAMPGATRPTSPMLLEMTLQ